MPRRPATMETHTSKTDMKMKLWIMSDLHLEFPEFAWRPERVPDHDVLVLAGDIHVPAVRAIEFAETLTDRPVMLIAGNHEFYGHDFTGTIKAARERAAASPNVVFLEDDIVEIGHVRFLGCTLWTDFALHGQDWRFGTIRACEKGMNDYKRIKRVSSSGQKRRIRPEHTLARHRVSRSWLEQELSVPFAGRTVVVTHHAPLIDGLAPQHRTNELAAAYASDLSQLIEAKQPDLWIHGHTHLHLDWRHGPTRVVSNARGYGKQNAWFDPGFVVDI